MIRLGGPDVVSIRLLEGWPHGLVFSPLVNQSSAVYEFLIENYFRNGAALFGRETPEDLAALQAVCGTNLDARTIYFHLQYFVQRVRNYGHVESLQQARIRKARSTGECHDVRIVNVADAVSWVKWFKTLSPEEYCQKVFGKDYKFPPFDVECRCRLEGIIPGLERS